LFGWGPASGGGVSVLKDPPLTTNPEGWFTSSCAKTEGTVRSATQEPLPQKEVFRAEEIWSCKLKREKKFNDFWGPESPKRNRKTGNA